MPINVCKFDCFTDFVMLFLVEKKSESKVSHTKDTVIDVKSVKLSHILGLGINTPRGEETLKRIFPEVLMGKSVCCESG